MQKKMKNIQIYFNENDNKPTIFITNDEDRLLLPISLSTAQEPITTIEQLKSDKTINEIAEKLEEPIKRVESIEQLEFIDTINDWIQDTLPICQSMVCIFSDGMPDDRLHNWTRYFRVKETAPGRFRPSVFRKPEYIIRNRPAIVRPKEFFDRIAETEEKSEKLMKAWEKYVAENQEVFIEVLNQSFEDWMKIYGDDTPVKSCMTGNKGRLTASFYELIPEAYPCLIRTRRKAIGRCIVWNIDGNLYHDRIYASSQDYRDIATEAFQKAGILSLENKKHAIPITAQQWKQIQKLQWIPYLDNFDIAAIHGKGVFLFLGSSKELTEETTKAEIFVPDDTNGNKEILHYVETHYNTIYPKQE